MCRHIVLTSKKEGEILNIGPWKRGARSTISVFCRALSRSVSLHNVPEPMFARCQWQTTHSISLYYLIYRWALVSFFVTVSVLSFAFQKLTFKPGEEKPDLKLNYFKWFIYLTNWGLLTCTVQAVLALIVLHKNWNIGRFDVWPEENERLESGNGSNGSSSSSSEAPLIYRVYWAAHVMAVDMAFVITLVYWIKVHDPVLYPLNAINVLVHAFNSIAMLIELWVLALPCRVGHFLYPATLGLAYCIFTAVYWAAKGTSRTGESYIYPALDWSKPSKAFTFVAACFGTICFAHCAYCLIVMLRRRIATSILVGTRATSTPQAPSLTLDRFTAH